MDPEGNWTLPPDTTAAAVARRIVASALTSWRDPDDAVLVVSELVTNAVQHGLPPIELELNLGAGRLRLTVSNAVGATMTVPRIVVAGDDEPHGRGLAIVEALSAEWGWCGTDRMMSVWAELIDSTVGEHTAVSEVHITASARVNRSCK
jgi:anti-sigma regulatory factor (Ser/Thr protein kinase)